ncbi:hypothetical protein HJC23_007502 [Cyclotella cryptica]|uniref:Uncharacterized protein n=1 Tax=Cyclotella cryptica TaxID=29204 RepID=A0ABD3PUJ3_9STRA
MGCSHSQYPLPAGKHNQNTCAPKSINVKEQIPRLSKDKPLTPPKQHLSPLRTTIVSDEVARPQSEETARTRERFDITEYVNTDTLDAIKEDELFNIPQSFDKEDLDRSISNEVKDGEESVDSNKCNTAKLTESCFIDVLMIESKIVPFEPLPVHAALESPVKCNSIDIDSKDVDSCLVVNDCVPQQEVSNDNTGKKLLSNKAHKVTFKDRVIFGSAVVFLVLFYFACILSVGWISLKGIQGARHVLFPVPRRLFHSQFNAVAANGLFSEVNQSNTLRTIETDCGDNHRLIAPAHKGSQTSEVIRHTPISSPSIKVPASLKEFELSRAVRNQQQPGEELPSFGDQKIARSRGQKNKLSKSSLRSITIHLKNFDKIKFPNLISLKDIKKMIDEGSYFI